MFHLSKLKKTQKSLWSNSIHAMHMNSIKSFIYSITLGHFFTQNTLYLKIYNKILKLNHLNENGMHINAPMVSHLHKQETTIYNSHLKCITQM